MSANISVLWWDNTLVAANSEGEPASLLLPLDGDALQAFCSFIEGLTPTPKIIRLFYAAPTLNYVVARCPPKATRTVMRDVLKTNYPVLENPDTAWAVHKVSNPKATSTVLYIEQEPPRLQRLRAMLAGRGINLIAAFPLLTLVEETPQFSEATKPTLALLHTAEACAVFWTNATGERHAAFFQGETAIKRATTEVQNGFSIFEGQTVSSFIVINAGGPPFDTAELPQKPAKVYSTGEFLQLGNEISPRELSNLLPPPSRLSSNYLCSAAAIILFGLAALNGLNYMAAVRAAQADLALQKAQEQQLTTEISTLQSNKTHIDQMQAMLNEVAPPSTVKSSFLDALGHGRPLQITFHSATVNESTWTVTGTIHEGIGVEKGPFEAFIRQFSKAGPWTLGPDSQATVLKMPDFTLNGTFP
jgi:hypothetical protein